MEITQGHAVVYRGPVIVGRVDRPTPFIDSTIKSLLINPVWHVPTSIAKKDILPKLRKDPNYLKKEGITVDGDPDGKDIDWKNVSPDDFNLKLRQESGDMNSLGRIKLDFENSFSVYMHGTPHQSLFGKNQRSLSSGCVRLRDPTQVAQIVLEGTEGDWTTDKIEAAIATDKTQRLQLAQPMPILYPLLDGLRRRCGQAELPARYLRLRSGAGPGSGSGCHARRRTAPATAIRRQNSRVIPAFAGIHFRRHLRKPKQRWIPARAEMTFGRMTENLSRLGGNSGG